MRRNDARAVLRNAWVRLRRLRGRYPSATEVARYIGRDNNRVAATARDMGLRMSLERYALAVSRSKRVNAEPQP